jgi:Holliday junction resolvase
MNTKAKGSNGERSILHKFWQTGWSCVRVAGSGSMKYPSPDLLASNVLRKLAIECKCIAQESYYFDKSQITDLRQFCSLFGAEPWVAVKFQANEWMFFNLEDLKETEKGYSINLGAGDMKGLSFEELTKGF